MNEKASASISALNLKCFGNGSLICGGKVFFESKLYNFHKNTYS